MGTKSFGPELMGFSSKYMSAVVNLMKSADQTYNYRKSDSWTRIDGLKQLDVSLYYRSLTSTDGGLKWVSVRCDREHVVGATLQTSSTSSIKFVVYENKLVVF